MSASRTPRETVDLLLHTFVHGRRAEIAELYAPDVRIENPWIREEMPREFEGGRATLKARMEQTEHLWSFDSVREVSVYEGADPEIIVLEFRLDVTVSESGAKFSLGFVSIMRIVDGLIVWSRDYSNPLETAELAKLLDFGS